MKRTVLILALGTGAAAAQMLPEPVQFVDRSVIVFPDAVDNYTLAQTEYDPTLQSAGVTSKWAVHGAPRDLLFTVFVYPIPPASEQQAVVRHIDAVALQMQQVVEHGTYSRLVPGDRSTFEVDAPPASLFDPLPAGIEHGLVPPGTFDDEAEAAEIFAAALKMAQVPTTNHGVRQRFRFDHDGVAMRSIAYVFYRQLYAVKVRASTPADSMDDATFEALADKATRTLLPRIRAENFGTCGIPRIEPPASDAERDDAQVAAREMLRAATMLKAANCRKLSDPRDAVVSADDTRVEIVYAPGSWTQRDPG